MSTRKKVTAEVSSEPMPSDSRSLLNKILVATRDFINRKIDEEQLERAADDVEKSLDREIPSLAISSLCVNDVEKILNLKWTRKDPELASVPPLQSPPALVQHITRVNRALDRRPTSEANVRWILNALLQEAFDIATTIHPHAAQPLNIQAEKGWKYGPVKWHRKKYYLSGRPGYGVWYGEDEDFSLNVVVIEAKREEGGRAQALGYMGCVHRQRKELKKKDCTIYGIASDGYAFTFLKIDNDSKWCDYSMYTRDGNYDQILGLLVHIFTKAAAMSLAHSKQPSRKQEGAGDSAMTRLSIQEYVKMTG
ncbi:hypothetical protein N7457_003938 [Penicillium paradoxum]|uniref:uncharacterized protein n=1 Tax=Penicillium paradoxum TaxID=176176 RepID=UPI0025491ED3|nr:uncharacterized protein N7457_003938 [Penicillium paradoxum]KAJ5782164.1 hypothetical protein N7457_003938 [Penicillium paradoxum]